MIGLEIKRSFLPDEVIEHIKIFITTGKLKPGDKLPAERELAQMFSVSRTTIREALKVLVNEGIVIRNKKGAAISNINHNSFINPIKNKIFFNSISYEELIESRKHLEVEIAGLAAERRTNEDLAEMRRNLHQTQLQIDLNNERDYIFYSMEFHELIALASKNRFYVELIVAIRQMIRDAQSKITSPEVMIKCLNAHQQIHKAIQNKEIIKTRERMLAHLVNVKSFHL